MESAENTQPDTNPSAVPAPDAEHKHIQAVMVPKLLLPVTLASIVCGEIVLNIHQLWVLGVMAGLVALYGIWLKSSAKRAKNKPANKRTWVYEIRLGKRFVGRSGWTPASFWSVGLDVTVIVFNIFVFAGIIH